jgi:hypothetical protein
MPMAMCRPGACSRRDLGWCVGIGDLDVVFAIGDGESTQSMGCSPSVVASSSLVVTTGEASGSVVTIKPSDDAVCEIAYRIDLQ